MADLVKTLEPVGEITLSGKQYKLGKLTLEDWAVARKWCIDKRKEGLVADAKAFYGENIPVEVFNKISTPPTDDELEIYESDPDWIKLLFQLAIAKHHPDITMEQLGKIITFEDLSKIPSMLIKEKASKKVEQPEIKNQ